MKLLMVSEPSSPNDYIYNVDTKAPISKCLGEIFNRKHNHSIGDITQNRSYIIFIFGPTV